MIDDTKKLEVSNRVFVLLIAFLIGLAGFWGFRIYEIWTTATGNYAREVSIEATGKAYAAPDVALVNLGIEAKGKTAGAAVKEGTKVMNSVSDELVKMGVEKKDIKTTSYYLSPNYNWTQSEGSKQEGYVLNQSVTVKVRDLEKVGDIIAKATSLGANTVGDLSFTVDDEEKAKDEARKDAIEKVKAKAKLMAEQAGFKLGDAVSYYEYAPYNDGKSEMMYASADSGMGGGGATSTPQISAGEQEIQLTVSMSYRLYY